MLLVLVLPYVYRKVVWDNASRCFTLEAPMEVIDLCQ